MHVPSAIDFDNRCAGPRCRPFCHNARMDARDDSSAAVLHVLHVRKRAFLPFVIACAKSFNASGLDVQARVDRRDTCRLSFDAMSIGRRARCASE
ncbi:hypothetical protein BN2476_320030 [Paraburkholderia piptadeniae]|uniref:Uncharacterized protein n=1 Tax=Paraburkholderia piptadeniae TaxID=1701573 RepID=A0A1N7S4I6_9BURK|nr:hypothetical protein BN2476_320030 [Paraburkholderia piptadeniae]